MAMNSPNVYDSLALYRTGAQDGRPYGKALGVYEFAGNNTILAACTAQEAGSLPYRKRVQLLPAKQQFIGIDLELGRWFSIARKR